MIIVDSINIFGDIRGHKYRLEYGEGSYPINWTLIDSGYVNISGFITTWHISDIINGTYTLKLSVEDSNRVIFDRTTIQIKRNAFPLFKGWPVATTEEIHSSAVVDDLDSDGNLEIIMYASDGYLYVWNKDGTNKQGWPKYLGASRSEIGIGPKQNWVIGSPAVADIDNDGQNEYYCGFS